MVQIDGENSDQIDPIADHSSLSLFPRSFTSLRNCTTSIAGSVYSHLKSMVLRSPATKTVLDDSLNLIKNDKTSAMASQEKTDAFFITNEKNHQVKRPALGLKQAKFSLKPMPRQLDTMTEPIIDINKLEDPLEFFEAYERVENAKKEMQKLRGEPLNQFHQNLFSLPLLRKRPSLLGKSATYKYQSYTSKATDDNNKILLSFEERSANHSVQSETDDLVHECESGQASITKSLLPKETNKMQKTKATKRKVREKKSKVSSQASPASETANKEMEANTLLNAIVPTEPPNKKRKQIVDTPVTRKKNDNRMAVMKWDAGVRRSTRIRMRPLEYWKGERFLYGRVHDSLVTVIGVKYASPSKEAEESRIKVKSFVSDEHKHKLEGAALY